MKKAAVFLFSLSMLSILVFTGCAKSTAPTPSATPSPGVISVREESVVIGEGTEYELGGTLTIPEGAQAPYPAVLLVHGSGPNDRDETIYANKPFRDIAEHLTSKGIAVLRYDKRTYVHPAKMAESFAEITVKEETIDDAILASKLLKADERIDKDRVFILGHSMGGMLAPRIDAEGGDFAGLIILAGSPRPLADIILDQIAAALETLSGEQKAAAQEQLDTLTEVFARLDTMSDEEAKGISLTGASAYYFKEMAEHPASEYLSDIEKPVLILQGGKDFQVYADKDYVEYQSLLDGKPNVAFKLYPELNHLFMTSTTGTAVEYMSPGKVDSEVLEDIAEWILNAKS
jgi:dienelactone hydrolase